MSSKDIEIQQGHGNDIVDITELINPFPGLRPFGVEESHLFFGREGQSDEALQKLANNRFVGILGASGSGKSSFMFCGLIPTLHGGFMTEAGSNWRIVTSRPGGGPIDNLAESLLTRDQEYNQLSDEDKLIKRTIISTVLRSSSLGLVEVVKQLKTDDFQNVLILVDQFEELFRFSKEEAVNSDQNEAAAFVNLLLEACDQTEVPIYVALTMRSDFIGECSKYMELTHMINESHYLIPQMVRDQKRMAIEGPVAVGGGKIAPRLTQQLLNDAGDSPDMLPILQHALMRTWSYWVDNRKPDQPMDLEHYNAIGTLTQALSQHANEAYDMLNKREKQICETMFKALTEKGAENTGIRRPTKLSTIASIAGVSEDEVERVVDRFREPGRSLLMPPYGVKLESETVIDISHESLMRIWDRLKQWLDEEAKATEMYVKLSEASKNFQEGKASLWQMPDLQLAINWREENNPTLLWGQRINPAYERTMVFLETSEKAFLTEQKNKEILQKRKVRTSRIVALICALAAMTSLFFIVLAQMQTALAEESLLEAKRQEALAEANAQEAKENAEQALQAATEATLARNEAEAARDQAVLAQQEAERQQKIADEQRQIAEEQKVIADENAEQARLSAIEARKQQGIAEEATDVALAAEAKAKRLRYQAISQSMGVKARGIVDEQLRALVAKQGFDFYHEFKDPGKEFNGDIYAGAYYGFQGLLRQDFHKKNPDMGALQVAQFSDSSFNQFHGHIPIDPSGFASTRQVSVKSITISSDGQRMYSADADGKLFGWDIASRTYTELYDNQGVDRVVQLSPDEKRLALGTSEGEIDIFELADMSKKPQVMGGHTGSIFDLVFLPDNSGFISVGQDRKILLHNYEDYIEIARMSAQVKTIAISPDGLTLATGATNGDVSLINLREGSGYRSTVVYRRNKENLPVSDITFSNSGRYLGIGGSNYETGRGYVMIWDLVDKQQYGPDLTGFASEVSDVEFSKGDKLIAAASRDKTARFWDMRPDNIYDLPTVLDDHGEWVLDISFHPDGDRLFTASGDGLIREFPTKPDGMIENFCGYLERNMMVTEWRQFVADPSDIEMIETCEGLGFPSREE
ncbi:MAG: High-affnity carbon uptake protein Hat/HatR [Cyclobacteriaceae bacterium]